MAHAKITKPRVGRGERGKGCCSSPSSVIKQLYYKAGFPVNAASTRFSFSSSVNEWIGSARRAAIKSFAGLVKTTCLLSHLFHTQNFSRKPFFCLSSLLRDKRNIFSSLAGQRRTRPTGANASDRKPVPLNLNVHAFFRFNVLWALKVCKYFFPLSFGWAWRPNLTDCGKWRVYRQRRRERSEQHRRETSFLNLMNTNTVEDIHVDRESRSLT